MVAGALWKSSRGVPLFARVPHGAQFVEKYSSGRFLDSWLSRIGGASRCLMTAVTNEDLLIQVQFPFSILPVPPSLELTQRIPRSSIRSVSTQGQGVIVSYEALSGDTRRLELLPRQKAALLSALGK